MGASTRRWQLCSSSNIDIGSAFHVPACNASYYQQQHRGLKTTLHASEDGSESTTSTKKTGDNKAMAFLRKVGRVGGAANMDFANAMGLDESPSGAGTKSSYHKGGSLKNVRKSKAAYTSCTTSGIIDDMSDPFPFTSSGSQWQGIFDCIMGGMSNGSLSRENIGDKVANVLRGNVADNTGFIQMLRI